MTTLVEYLTNLESNELVEDDFGNLRYIGADPNNYVLFNNELWRIIGVMKDIENVDGTKEDKVKLIRNKSIGEFSWDNKAVGVGSSTSSYGSNDWSDSSLQKVLNEGAYYNRTSGICPNGQYGATTPCDFSNTGLTEEAKEMISEVVWNLGGSSTYNDVIAKTFYERERGTTVYSGRPVTWKGKVGLMYSSDYGYATSGGAKTDRNTCLNKEIYNWDGSDCKNNDWLLANSFQWTITPNSPDGYAVFYVILIGGVVSSAVYNTFAVHPSVYLELSIGIENGGIGTSTSPFVLKN